MPCILLDLTTACVMPWKNGGGTTQELAIAPAGAGLDDFAWRISSAQVHSAGAFSTFVGIDRSLALLSGAGLRLQRSDGGVEELHSGGAVAQFAGEQAISATLLDGPVSDLNVMTRRGAWRHQLTPRRLLGREVLANDAELMLLWCQAGADIECRLPDGEQRFLQRGQGLLLQEQPGALTLHAQQPALLYLAWLYRQPHDSHETLVDG